LDFANCWISLFDPGSWPPKLLHGNARISKPLSLNYIQYFKKKSTGIRLFQTGASHRDSASHCSFCSLSLIYLQH
jgi:hypothetical protein